MRIAILPTGRTEYFGMPTALARLFPGHHFYCLPGRALVDSESVSFPYNGFTSTTLSQPQLLNPPESARELVATAAQEALGDRRSQAADLVLILDDLELANISQPAVVVEVMRLAVVAHLRELEQYNAQVAQRTRALLAQRVSFHLISPMIEGWFFADNAALSKAGVANLSRVVFDPSCDPEAFRTKDPLYLAATEADCPAWSALPRSRQKKRRPKWLGSRREEHPKGYLQWLCRDPTAKSCTSYNEAQGGGAEALVGIDWSALLSRASVQMSFMRSMIEDLEVGLDQHAAIGPIQQGTNRLTSITAMPQQHELRNIGELP